MVKTIMTPTAQKVRDEGHWKPAARVRRNGIPFEIKVLDHKKFTSRASARKRAVELISELGTVSPDTVPS